MRAFLLLCCVLLVQQLPAIGQEDVLRPNGRARSSSSSSSPEQTIPADDEPGLVIRGGIEGGMGINLYQKSIEGILSTSPLSLFESGSGLSPLSGVYAEVEVSPTFALGLRVMSEEKVVDGSKNGLLQDCIVTDEYGTPTQITVVLMSGEFTQTITYITITPTARFNVMNNVFVQVGPTIHLPEGDLRTTTTFTIDPADQCFFNFGQLDQSKVRTVTDVDSNPSMRVGLDVAIGYRLHIGNNFEIVPRLGYQLMVTPLDSETTGEDPTRINTDPPARSFVARGASLNSLQATLALWFRL